MHQSLRHRSKSTAEESARAGEGGSTSFEGVRVSISMRTSQNEDNNNDYAFGELSPLGDELSSLGDVGLHDVEPTFRHGREPVE